MLRFHIVTLFPSFFGSALATGLMERAVRKGLVSVDFVDPREFSEDRHRHVDDRPYGGGPGMVMQAAPLAAALRSIPSPGRMLCMAPNGRKATQEMVRRLAKESDVTILCGRYEGMDARIFDVFPLEPVCVGDIVMNGGETAALALVEAVSRLVPGFMGKEASGDEESFSGGLLEYPHFTRPPVWEGEEIPAVLANGHHGEIAAWRRARSLQTTLERRPELLEEADLGHDDAKILAEVAPESLARNLHLLVVDSRAKGRGAKKTHASMTEEGRAATRRVARAFGLGGCRIAPEGEDAVSSLLDYLDEMEGRTGRIPSIFPVSHWQWRLATVGAAAVRRDLKTGPCLIVMSASGTMERDVLHQAGWALRPPLFLRRPADLDAPAMAAVLLDRVLGDFL